MTYYLCKYFHQFKQFVNVDINFNSLKKAKKKLVVKVLKFEVFKIKYTYFVT